MKLTSNIAQGVIAQDEDIRSCFDYSAHSIGIDFFFFSFLEFLPAS